MTLCRKCGVELDNEVTRALGICTSCVEYDGDMPTCPLCHDAFEARTHVFIAHIRKP